MKSKCKCGGCNRCYLRQKLKMKISYINLKNLHKQKAMAKPTHPSSGYQRSTLRALDDGTILSVEINET